ncbi:MAG: hypothetical protein HY481_00095 [Candidatus Vogelbacteria bacterium]|nr:hypothetical protein [Candidatus Vogelbacteria bacterium]
MIELLKNQLEKFRRFDQQHREANKILIDTIFKYSGVKITANDFTWRGRNIYLKTSPLKKTQIFLKQNIILRQLEEIFGRGAPKKIL